MNKGFTLIELLVVILIIGILSAVALPQYTSSVERSRAAEAMVNAKAIMDGIQRYRQLYPSATGNITFANIADVQLRGVSPVGEDGNYLRSKNFNYVLTGPNQLVVARRRYKSLLDDTPLYEARYTYSDAGVYVECCATGQWSDTYINEGAERICKTFQSASFPENDSAIGRCGSAPNDTMPTAYFE